LPKWSPTRWWPRADPKNAGRRIEILEYTRSFADAYGVRAGIRFGTSVRGGRQEADGDWTLDTSAGEVRACALARCTGVTWHPRMPAVPEDFDGEVIHSVDYRAPSIFAEKRVLIVGLGNSGADIACDAAPVADTAFISTRRGYHFIPKFLAGTPSDHPRTRRPGGVRHRLRPPRASQVPGPDRRRGRRSPTRCGVGHGIVKPQN